MFESSSARPRGDRTRRSEVTGRCVLIRAGDQIKLLQPLSEVWHVRKRVPTAHNGLFDPFVAGSLRPPGDRSSPRPRDASRGRVASKQVHLSERWLERL